MGSCLGVADVWGPGQFDGSGWFNLWAALLQWAGPIKMIFEFSN
jgi:hypothetical protein